MRAWSALRIKYCAFRKCQSSAAVYQPRLGHQYTLGRPHEASFHFNRDNTHIGLHGSRCVRHADIQQRHRGTAVYHIEAVEVLWLRNVAYLSLTIFKPEQLKAKMLHKRDGDRKLHRAVELAN